jgi:hypothetical protein
MAEVVNELDFASIDNAINTKRKTVLSKLQQEHEALMQKPIDPPKPTPKPDVAADWDNIKAEQPPRQIDWAKAMTPATNYVVDAKSNGFDWSRYKSDEVDEFLTFDDDFDDIDEKLPPIVSTYRGNSHASQWWDDIDRKSSTTASKKQDNWDVDVDDVYEILTEMRVRLDKVVSDVDDLTDTVKSQYSTMMKMIKSIHGMLSDARAAKPA